MAHGHASRIDNFIETDENTLVGRLVNGVASTGISSHRSTQIKAWQQELRLLKEQLAAPQFNDWFIILEYEIPRRSRRPDVIILNSTTIFVVEFKTGARGFDPTACWQANSYARDLRDFHAESYGHRIVPILCATDAEQSPPQELSFHGPDTEVADLIKTNGSDLGSWLLRSELETGSSSAEPIVPDVWLSSAYRPTPTIIEAATFLYTGHGVRELSHRHAHNLDRTTEMLVKEIEDGRKYGRRVICFVTGVPGAGKTLTGLNVVHSPNFQQGDSLSGIFLSGNGPLVKIIREALVRSEVRKGYRRGDSQHKVTTFIQNVHDFLRYHLEQTVEQPHEHVVVFDEAQRAWDQSKMLHKRGVEASEATLLFDVMERFTDWSVIVALVGGGQEIFLGEAGLEEWGRALENRAVPWRVVASPEVLIGGDSVAGHKLFDKIVPDNVSFQKNSLAHLDVVVRNHRAQRWAEWVNELLSYRYETALPLFPDSQEFPCFLTRDIEKARAWLRMHHRLDSDQKIGLVATSEDQRLRAYGLERSSSFRLNYAFEKWFLEPPTDVRSSFSLEVAASEFECQGLELDWVGMCWGGDLTPSEDHSGWDYRKFRGARWQNVRKDAEQAYTRNRYRVLLTRARSGLVIWVPKGDLSDPTRDPERFDRVFTTLRKAGVPLLEDHFEDELSSSPTC